MEDSPKTQVRVVAKRSGSGSPSMPPVQDQAMNALRAVGRVGMAVVRREKVARSPEAQAQCLALCEACDQWDAARKRCAQCGCFTVVKARLATEHCPLEKW